MRLNRGVCLDFSLRVNLTCMSMSERDADRRGEIRLLISYVSATRNWSVRKPAFHLITFIAEINIMRVSVGAARVSINVSTF